MTIHATHGQLLLDVLTEFQALQVDLASASSSTPQPPPFDDKSWLPFGNSSQKGGVHMHGDRGSFGFYRLYLGAS